MTAEHDTSFGGFVLDDGAGFRMLICFRDALALASVADGSAWADQTNGHGVWHMPRVRLNSAVYGIGEGTLHKMLTRGLITEPVAGRRLTLTKVGRDVLDAIGRLKDRSVVGMTVEPHPCSPQRHPQPKENTNE